MYKIVRYYYRSSKKRTIKKNLTLEEAQKHCSDPKTKGVSKKFGKWFDGYTEQ